MGKERYKVSFSQKGERKMANVEIDSKNDNLNKDDKIYSVVEQVKSIAKDVNQSEVENITIQKVKP